RPKTEGGEYYWSVSLLRAPTLLDAAHQAGRKTAAITWPVTVDAPLDWNLPEYFHRRRGGSMDLASIESRSKPKDLVARITAEFPSFPQEWMDDRTRTQAVVYLLRHEHPDLLLVHLVDLDSEEHDNGPFSREAYAVLERTDELIGQMLAAMPKGSAAAVVSDHGFERVRTVVHLQTLAEQRGATGVQAMGGIAVARDAGAAAFLRGVAKEAQFGVGREIPPEEVKRFPSAVTAKAAAVFESAEGFQFSPQPGTEILGKPEEAGNHGHWPLRYRSVFVLWGPGIARETLPEFSIKEIAGRLAKVIDVPFTR
ncbi:MAG TPA: alkaline phosphatase family protein, partial [Bryobacteraceae bacterium]|nr:alkaline phosphatase family protein [Bryobacteraceae bacterium]